jgi:N6-adenosine-specific RNA methylase IME4
MGGAFLFLVQTVLNRLAHHPGDSGEILAAPHPFAGLKFRYYGALLVDMPSKFSSYTAIQSQNPSSRRDNERHYAVMSFAELAALPLLDLAAPTGCHLFVCTSGPFLPQAIALIAAWGFKYSTRAFTWVKLKPSVDLNQLRFLPFAEADLATGLGLTVRHQTELVLLARRGNCRRASKSVREVIFAPRREHSRKPDEIYRRIQQYCVGPYAELFARQRRPGWNAWGNEVEKFTPYDAADDFAKSLDEGYRAIRARVVAGGKGWAPK